jgi:hypothetical protein
MFAQAKLEQKIAHLLAVSQNITKLRQTGHFLWDFKA